MSEKFSPALRIGDLNDFIAPSQGCIVGQLKPNSVKPVNNSEKRAKAGPPVTTEPVKISLKDCLACSGCITSAETVMLEKQSLDEFLSAINKGKTVIVSISPQSRASLAAQYDLSPLEAFKKLTTFFKSLGVKAVFDTSCSRDLALMEACNEFIVRYKQRQSGDDDRSKTSLPMISSACPGWICYAEKTLGSYILPYISSVKSPQQTIGAVFKRYLCQKMSLRPDEVYHVTVMPCYDKKLEAAREDFAFEMEYPDANNVYGDLMAAEVDSVLTSGEVLELIQLKSVDLSSLDESPLDRMLANVTDDGYLYGVNGSSGGYADTIFKHAAKALFGRDTNGPLEFRMIRNSDFREVLLEVEGKTVLRFALCYGFRNLQNVVRKIKIGKCDYDFLEIMACPSGCLNGGGQIKPRAGQSAKDLIQHLESVYMKDVLVADPFQNPIARGLYDEWLEQPGSDKAKQYLHTEYHPLVKSITSQLHNW
ncbi:hypothetical protein BVRB_3g063540 [Beta vulgaris subsp. vulgaris]|uniref:protein NAR1 n=1 Tax=Beta vulgaris subsp. vulgaris TaxID=3555 RepID=UPI0005400778|nr:protein NAR1 [Beta vulgaris subsp. vulgaris]KMT15245.1 hypothetical protein BVRB_3g063540 [Beta vulgaris subsp. vulgaris]